MGFFIKLLLWGWATLSLLLLPLLILYHPSDGGFSFIDSPVITEKNLWWYVDIAIYALGQSFYFFPLAMLMIAWRFTWHLDWRISQIVFLTACMVWGYLLAQATLAGLFTLHVMKSSWLPPSLDAGGVIGNVVSAYFLKLGFSIDITTLLLIAIFLISFSLMLWLSWLTVLEKLGQAIFYSLEFIQKKVFFGKPALEEKLPEATSSKPELKINNKQTVKKINKDQAPPLQDQTATATEKSIDLEKQKPVGQTPSANKAEVNPSLLICRAHTDTPSTPTLAKDTSFNQPLDQTFTQPMDESGNEPFTQSLNNPVDKTFDKSFDSSDVTANKHLKVTLEANTQQPTWQLPKIELLHKDIPQETVDSDSIEQLRQDLKEYLLDYKIEAEVQNVVIGPVVIRFELTLSRGTRAARLLNISKDLARDLAVSTVRVVENIPGKSCLGLELPNPYRKTISFQALAQERPFQESHSGLLLALGVDIEGNPFFDYLEKMPHLLLAGTTGSGKSAGMNALIMSIIMRLTPDDVRFLMIDPKRLELLVYEGIPHLLAPVITEMDAVVVTLAWAVENMEARYRLLSKAKVRKLSEYNEKVSKEQRLPTIIIWIDEFADMMQSSDKQVADYIQRLAQKARAAGIHLVLATQRPSAQVISGVIKANIPARIAFQVSQKLESRIVLDTNGAEQLLGAGDMLYNKPGLNSLMRLHGAFVHEREVEQVVKFWQSQASTQYIEELLTSLQQSHSSKEEDERYQESIELVLRDHRPSASYLQQKMGIGFNRAARLINRMEEDGIVSPLRNGSRDILR